MNELRLKFEFEVLTPLFWGGADQLAELRPPALKGLLRYWYRAIDPSYALPWVPGRLTREARFFGGSSQRAGQSPFLLRVDSSPPDCRRWDEFRVQRFNDGEGRQRRNGLVYLGYPFQLRGNKDRTAIVPGHSFSVRCLIPNDALGEPLRQAIVASFWLFGHLGSAGSRARRGFGGLRLREWSAPAGECPELDQLPLLSQLSSPEEWTSEFFKALDILRTWFPDTRNDKTKRPHPHFGPAFRIILQPRAFPVQQWDAALNSMGRQLQDCRLRRQPDYDNVKNHITGQRRLQRVPARASFGLPLTFRYSSVNGRPVTFVPDGGGGRSPSERHGSLLHLRLAAIGDQLHPLFIRMDGDVPGESPPAVIRGEGTGMRGLEANAMDQFLDSIQTERA